MPIFYFDEEKTQDTSEQDLGQENNLSDEGKLPDINFQEITLFSRLNEEPIEFHLGAHYGYFAGHTNYEIGFDGGRSELEFPLKCWSVCGLKFGVTIPQLRLILDNAGYIGLYDRSGTMYDTDWDYTETIFSDTTSEAYLKRLLIWDSSLGFVFWQNFDSAYSYNDWNIAVSLLGGYRHEYFKYRIYDVYDVSGDITIATGEVLNYRVTYNIPYLGLKFNVAKPEANWGLSFRPCFSPFVRAKDIDDHLLRGKRSFGECTGWAAMVETNLFTI